MVAAVQSGRSLRSVARKFRVTLATVQKWVRRAYDERLDRVDWTDAPRGGRRAVRATSKRTEDLILRVRKQLKVSSDLGEFGAAAIHRALAERGVTRIPTIRTIGRILLRRGALDGRVRVRRPPPPKGWHLPRLAARQAELDSFDFVEGLVIRGGTDVMVLNAISLHGGLCGSWVRSVWRAQFTVETLIDHWREHGLPDYAQFDNGSIFQGNRMYPDAFGRVIRLCLQLGVIPVFAPPNETGFQAAIENYNGRWQAKVWIRFEHKHLDGLSQQSDRFVNAARCRAAARIESAPPRRPFPKKWKFNLKLPLHGTVIYLRRTNERGAVDVLLRRFVVDPLWPHRLVRVEVDLSNHEIRFYRLRRPQPDQQPLIKTVPYSPPTKPFRDHL
jgi:transposase-like protein